MPSWRSLCIVRRAESHGGWRTPDAAKEKQRARDLEKL